MKEIFLAKSKDNLKKTILVGATTLLSLTPNKKIISQNLDTLPNTLNSEVKGLGVEDKESSRVLTLIDNFEKKLEEKSDETSHASKPVFAIVTLDDIEDTLNNKIDIDKIPEGLIRENLLVDFVNNKQNENKLLIARDQGSLEQIDDEFNLVNEGYIDITANNKRLYIKPDFYVVVDKKEGKISAQLFSLKDKKLLDTVVLDIQKYSVLSEDDDGITNNILQDFSSLVQEKINHLGFVNKA